MKSLLSKLEVKGLAFFGVLLCLFYFYDSMPSHLKIIGLAFIIFLLLFLYRPWEEWLLLSIIFLPIEIGWIEFFFYLLLFAVGFLLFRFALSFLFFKRAKKLKLASKISRTERIALQVGESWVEKDFFTGRPNFKTLLNQKFPSLSKEEKEFLDTPVEKLCSLSTEWDFLKRRKLTQVEEEFLQKEKFFGLSIPKKYEGLAFSPFAHAKVIEKLAGYNIPLSIITMVPNSLGPAELLLKYGTEQQKDQYLPSLASAQLWPCFGLTEVQAGSSASSIQSEGVLFKEGGQLKIRLNFEKRWITLSAKADLIGLAIQLKDPDQLYSEKKDLG
ncbi:MAG: acyl-CoA dehydrogenase family protein, partial [Oligoflexia bacterium]|nr:acyl-CoA dehydrogenase family protein [Oligoflexia bacterium]